MTLAEIKEQLQEDLLCRLDGLDSETLDDVCDIVVQNLNCLAEK